MFFDNGYDKCLSNDKNQIISDSFVRMQQMVIGLSYLLHILGYIYNILYISEMLQVKSTILCPLCGIKFIPESGSICPTCTIKSLEQQKLLQGQQINYCRYCTRFERPPWINCQRQSQQMLSILLKKTKGLNKIQVQSASFVWTQPHSKRFKLKIVYSREIGQNMKIQVTEIVEYVEKYVQCNDCRKKFTPHDWIALVQVRQQTSHKKTILNLQQILLKQKLSQKILKTEQVQGGVDVFFSLQHDALRLVDFLKSRFPVSLHKSSKLISHNQRDNTTNLKITYSITIPKICRQDLIRIPRKLSKQLGSCCQVLLCMKVSSNLHFLDIVNFKKIHLTATQYFLYQSQIEIFRMKNYGKKFVILDCQVKEQEGSNKYAVYGVTFMKEDQYMELYTKSHFADEPGNQVVGYDLTLIQSIQGIKNIPDYLFVAKVKDKQAKKKNKSNRRKRQAEARKKQNEALSTLSKKDRQQEHEDQSDQNSNEDQWEDIQQKQNVQSKPEQQKVEQAQMLSQRSDPPITD